MSENKRSSLEDKWASQIEAEAVEVRDAGDATAEANPDEDAMTSESALQREIAVLQDQLLRAQADMANFRRRTERDRIERREVARAEVLRELLPVIDDFERAVEADVENAEAYRQGVELILKSLADTLERIGVSRVEPVGEPFDPHQHEAVERQPTLEVPDGHVVQVFKPGYRLGDRLLRAAMVAVASEPPEVDDGDDSAG